ncbi:MAG: hypothetical protein ACLPWD_07595 [Methanobacterium sp.]
MMEELELSEEWVEDTWKELEQARGEKLIKGSKKRSKKSDDLQEIILTFEDTDGLDLDDTYMISIKANSIVIGKQDSKKGTIKSVGLAQLKEKRFLEYIAWHDELIGLQLTMAFEKGFSIEIGGSAIIQELKPKIKK